MAKDYICQENKKIGILGTNWQYLQGKFFFFYIIRFIREEENTLSNYKANILPFCNKKMDVFFYFQRSFIYFESSWRKKFFNLIIFSSHNVLSMCVYLIWKKIYQLPVLSRIPDKKLILHDLTLRLRSLRSQLQNESVFCDTCYILDETKYF